MTVSTPGGASATSSADQYAYGPPSVSAVNPVTGPTAGGNTVTITGTNFVSGATVEFGSNAATSVNVQSTTTLTAVAPAGSDGTVDVTVSTPGGSSATSNADQYAYTPQAGAVFAVDSGNTGGSGQLVQILPSGAQTTLASGLNNPSGVGVDAAGDVFVVIFNSYVVEYPADGSAQRTLAGGGYPESLAVDPQGDVFVGNGNGVQEFPAGGGQVTLTSDQNLAYAPGLAVDSQGDVFASESSGGAVVEVHPDGTETTVASGLNSPQGLAVDLKGDVFIAENGSNQVVEVPAGGGSPTPVGSGLQGPTGVAIDAAGDLFIADGYPGDNNIIEVPAGGGAQTTLANLAGPTGVAAYAPAPTFTADSPPSYAPVGKAYSYTYKASTPPGEPNATFALASGQLPPGLTLNATTGVLSGTPTSSGTFTFVVQTQNTVQRSVSPLTGITTVTPTVSKASPERWFVRWWQNGHDHWNRVRARLHRQVWISARDHRHVRVPHPGDRDRARARHRIFARRRRAGQHDRWNQPHRTGGPLRLWRPHGHRDPPERRSDDGSDEGHDHGDRVRAGRQSRVRLGLLSNSDVRVLDRADRDRSGADRACRDPPRLHGRRLEPYREHGAVRLRRPHGHQDLPERRSDDRRDEGDHHWDRVRAGRQGRVRLGLLSDGDVRVLDRAGRDRSGADRACRDPSRLHWRRLRARPPTRSCTPTAPRRSPRSPRPAAPPRAGTRSRSPEPDSCPALESRSGRATTPPT